MSYRSISASYLVSVTNYTNVKVSGMFPYNLLASARDFVRTSKMRLIYQKRAKMGSIHFHESLVIIQPTEPASWQFERPRQAAANENLKLNIGAPSQKV